MEDKKIKIIEIDNSNATFFLKNGFLGMKFCADEEKEYPRVFLHRIFPFDKPWEYISVMCEESGEIGIIKKVDEFDTEAATLLKEELARKYYAQQIKTILSVKERYGFSYWKVITSENRTVNFTMQDTFRNIIRVGEDKAVLLDVDGNRFMLDSIAALDRKSYKKIELYL